MPRVNPYDSEVPGANWSEVGKKAIYTTGVASVGAYLLFGERGQGSFVGMQVPNAVAAGLGAGTGSVVSDLVSGYVIGSLNQGDEIKTAESTAIKLAVSGAGTVAALKYGSGVDPSLAGFGLGCAAKFGGDAVYQQLDPLGMLW